MWTATVDFTKAFDSISHNSIWEALKSCGIEHDYISLLRKIYRDQKASVQTDEESESFDIQKGSKQGDPMSSLLFNTVLQYSLKKTKYNDGKRRKGLGIYLRDQERDCLTNLRFADDVMLFATSKEQIRNTMCDFKKATEKVGLRIHPDKTKILSNQSTMNSDTKRYIDKERKREICGPANLVPPTRDIGNQEQDQSSMGDFPQIQTRTDIRKILAEISIAPLRCHSFSDSMLRSRNMDTEQRTRKNDSINATQDATTHHTNEKKIQKN